VQRWFRAELGRPTPAQCYAWPAIAEGKHLLLSAPTGSGKTLAAFLPILDRLLAEPSSGSVRCLYLSPLKALATDVRRTLRSHLSRLASYLPSWASRGDSIRVDLRTGDTSALERRRQRHRPPDVLLSTPESLAVMLTHPWATDWFARLCWVVIDEVHALTENKRGADLALSLERLTEPAGVRCQRIGLSATCAPLAEAAGLLVGTGRSCLVASVSESSPLDLRVEALEEAGGFLARLISRLALELEANRSTLVFTNTRSLAERLAWRLRERFPAWDESIAVHHSALAAGRRRVVERALRQGRLRAVVTTTSLELGIDIGAVDGVVLVHPPGRVVRLLQRVGRSGHQPGRPRRGLVLTANSTELLEAAVTAAACRDPSGKLGGPQQESVHLPAGPLDVLCQQLLGMAAQRARSAEEAWVLARRAYPYRDLAREDFDACLDYLSGRGRDGRDWLPARLRWEGERFVLLDDRTARIVRRNLGTILAEDQRPVHLSPPEYDHGSEASVSRPVGALDEAFADRLLPGDRFLLDGRCLEVRAIQAASVVVNEVVGKPAVPRWRADGWPLSAELARRLHLLRVEAAEALRDGPACLHALLRRDYALGEREADILTAYFQRQECVSEIPDGRALLVEVVPGGTRIDYYIHTPLSRPGNDALARVAVLRLARDRGRSVTSVVADLGFALLVSEPWIAHDGPSPVLAPDDFREFLATRSFEADLDAAIRAGSSLRERFQRTAFTGLMLLRNPLGRRRRVGGPDWAERRLFDKIVAEDPNFVLLRQAVREAREECCDCRATRAFLEDLERLPIRCRQLPAPSPFVQSWTQLDAGAVSSESPAEALERLHALLTVSADP
jgi:ATP-dependent Lhr-like helicase